MVRTSSKENVSVPRQEYLRLKTLEKRFQGFWHYIERLMDIREARIEAKQGKVISQDKLFKELGFDS